jgi:Uncharacterized protein conserved in bacteria (DUF2252)
MAGEQRRIISDPPMIVPVEESPPTCRPRRFTSSCAPCWPTTGAACSPTGPHLLGQFTLVQMARKIVGVGSVGTRAWVLLMDAAGG